LIAATSWRAATASKRWSRSTFPPSAPLPDEVTEADELYQNAGEKGRKHPDPADPPRHRANKTRGHGSWETDRVPIVGVVGRASGQIRLQVCAHSDRATLQPFVEAHTRPDATVNTDEWRAYDQLPATGRTHPTVCHTPGQREWARDADGDGVREVHDNTLEGIWTGLRNFLRPFRGVSKWFLSQYVTIFEWTYNLKRVTGALLRAMMCLCTPEPT
jgi:transposase-like protein